MYVYAYVCDREAIMTDTGNSAGPLPVTRARARLFDLVEALLQGRSARYELSHRGYEESVVLLRRSDVDAMEADLAALRTQLGPELRPLRGIGRLHVGPDEVVDRIRGRQRQLAADKRASLSARDDPA